MSLKNALVVAAGGGLGAALRYGMYFLFLYESFPATTLLVNLLGSVLIGAITGFALHQVSLSPPMLLFLQTGLCGGFTTFSTFSLEMFALLESSRYVLALLYAFLSIVLCLGGLFLGRMAIHGFYSL